MEQIINPIAYIKSPFTSKFGIPRQGGLSQIQSVIVFEPEYRAAEALRGLEGFSHIWLIWGFSENLDKGWSPTVRPPRLGGNKRVGVFATRSPFRPNPIGLSCVRLEHVDLNTPDGPIVYVSGADLMDGTPIYDIKPYLPFTDSRPDATGGFAEPVRGYALEVEFPAELLSLVPEDLRGALMDVLGQDPRPSYQSDPTRVYGVPFHGMDIRFTVQDGILTVRDVVPYTKER